MTDPCGAGVRVLVEHDRRLRVGRGAAEHALQDELVHAEVGLVQPEALDGGDVDRQARELVGDELRDDRHDLLEDLPAVLHEEQLARIAGLGLATIQETEVVADIVREAGHQPRAEHFEGMRARRLSCPALDEQRGRGIAEDEMAVAVAKVQVPGLQYQHGGGAAAADPDGRLQRTSRRRTRRSGRRRNLRPSRCCTSTAMAGYGRLF
jgi:hypothetical protein